ncbi:uncharacterized protein LOC114328438 isoform X2 [Diabrotica virgifera virgifera]|uniref:C2H2-type domain-containing protein n=1 Tax=Diabrotica virgifera virgifera TaxID=50390 RepID=A0ABM5KQJ4_DIAVI|nr:uncharacterized protein LOC114328438 isoform X2 [Diabrotica virgifera virgifera]
MSDAAYNKKMEELQRFIPFLEKLIEQLKTDPNKKFQLSKMESLYTMITVKKVKFETLSKCKDVISKIYNKMNPQPIESDKDTNRMISCSSSDNSTALASSERILHRSKDCYGSSSNSIKDNLKSDEQNKKSSIGNVTMISKPPINLDDIKCMQIDVQKKLNRTSSITESSDKQNMVPIESMVTMNQKHDYLKDCLKADYNLDLANRDVKDHSNRLQLSKADPLFPNVSPISIEEDSRDFDSVLDKLKEIHKEPDVKDQSNELQLSKTDPVIPNVSSDSTEEHSRDFDSVLDKLKEIHKEPDEYRYVYIHKEKNEAEAKTINGSDETSPTKNSKDNEHQIAREMNVSQTNDPLLDNQRNTNLSNTGEQELIKNKIENFASVCEIGNENCKKDAKSKQDEPDRSKVNVSKKDGQLLDNYRNAKLFNTIEQDSTKNKTFNLNKSKTNLEPHYSTEAHSSEDFVSAYILECNASRQKVNQSFNNNSKEPHQHYHAQHTGPVILPSSNLIPPLLSVAAPYHQDQKQNTSSSGLFNKVIHKEETSRDPSVIRNVKDKWSQDIKDPRLNKNIVSNRKPNREQVNKVTKPNLDVAEKGKEDIRLILGRSSSIEDPRSDEYQSKFDRIHSRINRQESCTRSKSPENTGTKPNLDLEEKSVVDVKLSRGRSSSLEDSGSDQYETKLDRIYPKINRQESCARSKSSEKTVAKPNLDVPEKSNTDIKLRRRKSLSIEDSRSDEYKSRFDRMYSTPEKTVTKATLDVTEKNNSGVKLSRRSSSIEDSRSDQSKFDQMYSRINRQESCARSKSPENTGTKQNLDVAEKSVVDVKLSRGRSSSIEDSGSDQYESKLDRVYPKINRQESCARSKSSEKTVTKPNLDLAEKDNSGVKLSRGRSSSIEDSRSDQSESKFDRMYSRINRPESCARSKSPENTGTKLNLDVAEKSNVDIKLSRGRSSSLEDSASDQYESKLDRMYSRINRPESSVRSKLSEKTLTKPKLDVTEKNNKAIKLGRGRSSSIEDSGSDQYESKLDRIHPKINRQESCARSKSSEKTTTKPNLDVPEKSKKGIKLHTLKSSSIEYSCSDQNESKFDRMYSKINRHESCARSKSPTKTDSSSSDSSHGHKEKHKNSAGNGLQSFRIPKKNKEGKEKAKEPKAKASKETVRQDEVKNHHPNKNVNLNNCQGDTPTKIVSIPSDSSHGNEKEHENSAGFGLQSFRIPKKNKEGREKSKELEPKTSKETVREDAVQNHHPNKNVNLNNRQGDTPTKIVSIPSDSSHGNEKEHENSAGCGLQSFRIPKKNKEGREIATELEPKTSKETCQDEVKVNVNNGQGDSKDSLNCVNKEQYVPVSQPRMPNKTDLNKKLDGRDIGNSSSIDMAELKAPLEDPINGLKILDISKPKRKEKKSRQKRKTFSSALSQRCYMLKNLLDQEHKDRNVYLKLKKKRSEIQKTKHQKINMNEEINESGVHYNHPNTDILASTANDIPNENVLASTSKPVSTTNVIPNKTNLNKILNDRETVNIDDDTLALCKERSKQKFRRFLEYRKKQAQIRKSKQQKITTNEEIRESRLHHKHPNKNNPSLGEGKSKDSVNKTKPVLASTANDISNKRQLIINLNTKEIENSLKCKDNNVLYGHPISKQKKDGREIATKQDIETSITIKQNEVKHYNKNFPNKTDLNTNLVKRRINDNEALEVCIEGAGSLEGIPVPKNNLEDKRKVKNPETQAITQDKIEHEHQNKNVDRSKGSDEYKDLLDYLNNTKSIIVSTANDISNTIDLNEKEIENSTVYVNSNTLNACKHDARDALQSFQISKELQKERKKNVEDIEMSIENLNQDEVENDHQNKNVDRTHGEDAYKDLLEYLNNTESTILSTANDNSNEREIESSTVSVDISTLDVCKQSYLISKELKKEREEKTGDIEMSKEIKEDKVISKELKQERTEKVEDIEMSKEIKEEKVISKDLKEEREEQVEDTEMSKETIKQYEVEQDLLNKNVDESLGEGEMKDSLSCLNKTESITASTANDLPTKTDINTSLNIVEIDDSPLYVDQELKKEREEKVEDIEISKDINTSLDIIEIVDSPLYVHKDPLEVCKEDTTDVVQSFQISKELKEEREEKVEGIDMSKETINQDKVPTKTDINTSLNIEKIDDSPLDVDKELKEEREEKVEDIEMSKDINTSLDIIEIVDSPLYVHNDPLCKEDTTNVQSFQMSKESKKEREEKVEDIEMSKDINTSLDIIEIVDSPLYVHNDPLCKEDTTDVVQSFQISKELKEEREEKVEGIEMSKETITQDEVPNKGDINTSLNTIEIPDSPLYVDNDSLEVEDIEISKRTINQDEVPNKGDINTSLNIIEIADSDQSVDNDSLEVEDIEISKRTINQDEVPNKGDINTSLNIIEIADSDQSVDNDSLEVCKGGAKHVVQSFQISKELKEEREENVEDIAMSKETINQEEVPNKRDIHTSLNIVEIDDSTLSIDNNPLEVFKEGATGILHKFQVSNKQKDEIETKEQETETNQEIVNQREFEQDHPKKNADEDSLDCLNKTKHAPVPASNDISNETDLSKNLKERVGKSVCIENEKIPMDVTSQCDKEKESQTSNIIADKTRNDLDVDTNTENNDNSQFIGSSTSTIVVEPGKPSCDQTKHAPVSSSNEIPNETDLTKNLKERFNISVYFENDKIPMDVTSRCDTEKEPQTSTIIEHKRNDLDVDTNIVEPGKATTDQTKHAPVSASNDISNETDLSKNLKERVDKSVCIENDNIPMDVTSQCDKEEESDTSNTIEDNIRNDLDVDSNTENNHNTQFNRPSISTNVVEPGKCPTDQSKHALVSASNDISNETDPSKNCKNELQLSKIDPLIPNVCSNSTKEHSRDFGRVLDKLKEIHKKPNEYIYVAYSIEDFVSAYELEQNASGRSHSDPPPTMMATDITLPTSDMKLKCNQSFNNNPMEIPNDNSQFNQSSTSTNIVEPGKAPTDQTKPAQISAGNDISNETHLSKNLKERVDKSICIENDKIPMDVTSPCDTEKDSQISIIERRYRNDLDVDTNTENNDNTQFNRPSASTNVVEPGTPPTGQTQHAPVSERLNISVCIENDKIPMDVTSQCDKEIESQTSTKIEDTIRNDLDVDTNTENNDNAQFNTPSTSTNVVEPGKPLCDQTKHAAVSASNEIPNEMDLSKNLKEGVNKSVCIENDNISMDVTSQCDKENEPQTSTTIEDKTRNDLDVDTNTENSDNAQFSVPSTSTNIVELGKSPTDQTKHAPVSASNENPIETDPSNNLKERVNKSVCIENDKTPMDVTSQCDKAKESQTSIIEDTIRNDLNIVTNTENNDNSQFNNSTSTNVVDPGKPSCDQTKHAPVSSSKNILNETDLTKNLKERVDRSVCIENDKIPMDVTSQCDKEREPQTSTIIEDKTRNDLDVDTNIVEPGKATTDQTKHAPVSSSNDFSNETDRSKNLKERMDISIENDKTPMDGASQCDKEKESQTSIIEDKIRNDLDVDTNTENNDNSQFNSPSTSTNVVEPGKPSCDQTKHSPVSTCNDIPNKTDLSKNLKVPVNISVCFENDKIPMDVTSQCDKEREPQTSTIIEDKTRSDLNVDTHTENDDNAQLNRPSTSTNIVEPGKPSTDQTEHAPVSASNEIPNKTDLSKNLKERVDISVCIENDETPIDGTSQCDKEREPQTSTIIENETKNDLDVDTNTKNDNNSQFNRPSTSTNIVEPGKPSTDEASLAKFFASMLGSQDKHEKKTALHYLINTFSETFSPKELHKINKIFDDEYKDSSDEESSFKIKKNIAQEKIKGDDIIVIKDEDTTHEEDSFDEELPIKTNISMIDNDIIKDQDTAHAMVIKKDKLEQRKKCYAAKHIDEVKGDLLSNKTAVSEDILEDAAHYMDQGSEVLEENLKSKIETILADKPRKKRGSELDRLHEDIREMFIRDDVLTASGKRMCHMLKDIGSIATTNTENIENNTEIEVFQTPKKVRPKCKNKKLKTMKDLSVVECNEASTSAGLSKSIEYSNEEMDYVSGDCQNVELLKRKHPDSSFVGIIIKKNKIQNLDEVTQPKLTDIADTTAVSYENKMDSSYHTIISDNENASKHQDCQNQSSEESVISNAVYICEATIASEENEKTNETAQPSLINPQIQLTTAAAANLRLMNLEKEATNYQETMLKFLKEVESPHCGPKPSGLVHTYSYNELEQYGRTHTRIEADKGSMITQSQLDTNLKPKSVFKPYRCVPGCQLEFLFINEFADHIATAHKKNNILICGHESCARQVKPKDISRHWSVWHNVSVYQCSYCRSNSNEINTMNYHLSVTHPNLKPEIIARFLSPRLPYYVFYTPEAFTKLRKIVDIPNIPSENTETKTQSLSRPSVIMPSPQNSSTTESNINSVGDNRSTLLSTPTTSKAIPNSSTPLTDSSNVTSLIEALLPTTPVDQPLHRTVLEESSSSSSNLKTLTPCDLPDYYLFKCASCTFPCSTLVDFKKHVTKSEECKNKDNPNKPFVCVHCKKCYKNVTTLCVHIQNHGISRFSCSVCATKFRTFKQGRSHMKRHIQLVPTGANGGESIAIEPHLLKIEQPHVYYPDDIGKIPLQSIFSTDLRCGACPYTTKVRMNMTRHLQFHLKKIPVPNSVNFPNFVSSSLRYSCCAKDCKYICPEEENLRHHFTVLHNQELQFTCVHCKINLNADANDVINHLNLHGSQLYKCQYCHYLHNLKDGVERHIKDKHAGFPFRVMALRCLESQPTVVEGNAENDPISVTVTSLLDITPIREDTIPIREDTIPIREDTNPIREGTTPTREDTTPIIEDSTPIIEDSTNARPVRPSMLFDESSSIPTESLQQETEISTPTHSRNITSQESPTPMDTLSSTKSIIIDDMIDRINQIMRTDVNDAINISNVENLAVKPKQKDVQDVPHEESISSLLKRFHESRLEFFRSTVIPSKIMTPYIKEMADSLENPLYAESDESEDLIDRINKLMRSDVSDIIILSDDEDDDIKDINMNENIGTEDEFGQQSLIKSFGKFGLPFVKQLKCPKCNNFKSRRMSDFIFHVFRENETNRFGCNICSAVSITYSCMYKHVQTLHKPFDASNIISLPKNPRLEVWLQILLRTQCAAIIGSSAMPQEISPDNSLNKMLCRLCYKWFKSEDENEHIMFHWTSLPFKCSDCRFEAYTRDHVLQHHIAASHGTGASIIEAGPTVANELEYFDFLDTRKVEEESSNLTA